MIVYFRRKIYFKRNRKINFKIPAMILTFKKQHKNSLYNPQGYQKEEQNKKIQ